LVDTYIYMYIYMYLTTCPLATAPNCPTRFAGKWARVQVSGCKYVQYVGVCMGTCVRRAVQVCLCVCVYAFIDIPYVRVCVFVCV